MQGKGRSKEYYIDARVLTAKKGKRSKRGSSRNNTETPISHSVSYNHHKYEKEGAIRDEVREEDRKIPLTDKQMKMMVRCLQGYCSFEN